MLREHLRTNLLNQLPAVDVVVRALPIAYATEGDKLRSDLTEITKRAFETVV